MKQAAGDKGNFEAVAADIRKCPSGNKGPPPFCGPAQAAFDQWNCWIGVYYGLFGNPLTGPFYYGNDMRPIKASRIRKPADAMLFTDTVTHYVYSPLVWAFDKDVDGDKMMDSQRVGFTPGSLRSMTAGLRFTAAAPTSRCWTDMRNACPSRSFGNGATIRSFTRFGIWRIDWLQH